MHHRRFLLIGFVFLLALVVSGLAIAQDKIELTLAIAASPSEKAAVEKQVAGFMEANPNIVVKVEALDPYDDTIQRMFASNDFPNVFYVGQSKLAEYARAGVLAVPGEGDLTDVEDIYPGLRDAYTYNGTFYCPAKDFSNLALEYNKTMFDAAGLDYPTNDWTWDDLRSAAEKLTKDGVVGFAGPADLDRFLAFYVQAGGKLYDEEGNFTFGGDAAIQALEFYVGLFRDGFAATPAGLGTGWGGEAFQKEKAAMTIEGNWVIQDTLDKAPDLKWGVVEMPAGPGGEGALTFSVCLAVGAGEVAGIVTNPYVKESWMLVDYMTGPEGAKYVATQGFGVLPARASAAADWKGNADYPAFVTGAANAVAPITPPGWQEWRAALNNGLQAMIDGSMTAQEVVDEVNEIAEDLASE